MIQLFRDAVFRAESNKDIINASKKFVECSVLVHLNKMATTDTLVHCLPQLKEYSNRISAEQQRNLANKAGGCDFHLSMIIFYKTPFWFCNDIFVINKFNFDFQMRSLTEKIIYQMGNAEIKHLSWSMLSFLSQVYVKRAKSVKQ